MNRIFWLGRYKSDPEAIRNKELERYVKIGTYCRQEPVSQSVLQEFEEVVGKVYKHKNEFQYGIPFIFVCSSSGMGKTQLPFTMNSPVIYFTYSSSDTQSKLLVIALDCNLNATFSRQIYAVYEYKSSAI